MEFKPIDASEIMYNAIHLWRKFFNFGIMIDQLKSRCAGRYVARSCVVKSSLSLINTLIWSKYFRNLHSQEIQYLNWSNMGFYQRTYFLICVVMFMFEHLLHALIYSPIVLKNKHVQNHLVRFFNSEITSQTHFQQIKMNATHLEVLIRQK